LAHAVTSSDQDSVGLTIRGAKTLATGGVMANEVFVTCIQPLRPSEERCTTL
jgi:4-hydroxyphenylacetate 3-monooxygenase